MALQMRKPALKYEQAYKSFHEEWKRGGEIYTPSFIRRDDNDFEHLVKRCSDAEMGIGLPEGWLPYSTYWLMEEETVIVGAVILRHGLTEELYKSEGHISLGIRPGERGKGYGSMMVKRSLEELGKLRIDRALVVCEAGNTVSERMIVRAGGMRDVDFTEEDGTVLKRYWISTS